jgi:DNA repair photolyase
MLISASVRTDIPAFYGRWFISRLRAGYCTTVNPFTGVPQRVSLKPDDVDGFVFWTKNATPFLSALELVKSLGIPFVVQYTITGYPRILEKSVPNIKVNVENIRHISEKYGPNSVVWRYDPIILSTATPPKYHLEVFSYLAMKLSSYVNEVTVSFVNAYRKTIRRLNLLGKAQGITWWLPEKLEAQHILKQMAQIAAAFGYKLTVCAQPQLFVEGTWPARCVDSDRFSELAGRRIDAKRHGNRPGCLCDYAIDIGRYETCVHGCVYCYAVSNEVKAKMEFRMHRPDSESL